jgi:hypothetical protein
MVATALYPGLRIAELLGLIWDDIEGLAKRKSRPRRCS